MKFLTAIFILFSTWLYNHLSEQIHLSEGAWAFSYYILVSMFSLADAETQNSMHF